MTKLILTRHGHVEGISPERFRGRAELPLTELGRREAEMTAARIAASWRPAAIYTSPMGRCVATGAAIAKPLGLAPSAILRLNDIDYGDWQGLTRDEALARRARPLVRAPGLGGDPQWREPAAGADPRRRGAARHRAAPSRRYGRAGLA
jgi:phosphoserine phosphatase